MTTKSSSWESHDDELLRELVHLGAPVAVICDKLRRTEQELRKRGYVLGLPMKWFKQRTV